MSHDALINGLATELAPVKTRSPWREASLVLALAVAELALLLGLGAMRPDMALVIGSPTMIWKLGSLAILAAVACVIAIRSFSPLGRPRPELTAVLGLAGLAVACGAFVGMPADSARPLLDRVSPVHGMLCAAAITVLALPFMAMMTVLMRRAAPTQPGRSAIAAGLAAATSSSLVFAFCCPMNDPLYIVVWYSAGCGAVTLAARWLLPRRFRL